MSKFLEAAMRPFAAHFGANEDSGSNSRNAQLYANMPLAQMVEQVEGMADLGFWRLDLATDLVMWSPGVFAIHDLPVADKVDLDNALAFYPPHHRPVIDAALKKVIADGTPFDLELDFISAKGMLKRVRSMCTAETAGGGIVAIVGLFQDITPRYLTSEKLRAVNLVDELTGLPNSRHLEQFYGDLGFAGQSASGETFALVMVGIVGLGQVGAKFGRHAQTAVLQTIAARLREPFGVPSFAARVGADDFGVLLRNPGDFDAVSRLSARIGNALHQKITVREKASQVEIEVEVAIGCVLRDAGPMPFTSLLGEAETVMQRARQCPDCDAIVTQHGKSISLSCG